MPTVREDRVFVEQGETLVAYVAAGLGVTAAHISGSKVGEFALEHRCDARDVAATGLGVATATGDGVRLLPTDGSDFAATGFDGAAVAVTGFDGGVLAAGEDGTVAHYDGSEWTERTDLPVDEPVVDAAHAVDTTVILTATGTLVVDDHADGDTRHRSLGLPDAAAVAVVGEAHADSV